MLVQRLVVLTTFTTSTATAAAATITATTAAATGGDESGGLGGARSAMWPVSISRGSLIAVALRGAEQQPVTFPRPVVTVVELAVPGVRGQEGTANDKFESSLMTVQVRQLLCAACLQ
jgi:hypothetical protein